MKIKEVKLKTCQLEAISSFYDSLIGLEILDKQAAYSTFRAGESSLTFQTASSGESGFYHVAFTIPTNKFVEAKQWVKDLGISLFAKEGQDEFPLESWNATSLYFYDPDANLIEFIAHHSLDNAANEPFGPNQLLRISEIGLPVEHVPETVHKLKDAFQLSLWGGDGIQFAPLGDVQGLLIVVDEQRPWFPDGRAPAMLDTHVTLEAEACASLQLQNSLYEVTSV